MGVTGLEAMERPATTQPALSALEGAGRKVPAIAAIGVLFLAAAAALAYFYGHRMSSVEPALFFFNGGSIAAAVTASYMFASMARLLRDDSLLWPAYAFGIASVAILLQSATGQDVVSGRAEHANGIVGMTSDGVALEFLVFEATLTVAVLLRAMRVPWVRWKLLAFLPIVGLLWPVMDRAPLPNLVEDDLSYTLLFGMWLAALTVVIGAVLLVWVTRQRSFGWVDIWLGFSMLAGVGAVALRALSDSRLDPWWWTSISVRSLQFVIPAAGLLATFSVFSKALEEQQQSLAEGFRDEIHRLRNLAQVEVGERYRNQVERAEIERVIRDEALYAVFQPIVRLADGQIVGAECLTRFTTKPKRPPDVWFGTAHRAGLGVDLENLALRHAVQNLASLPDLIYLSVNVSPVTISSDEFRQVVATVPAERLVVEITEHDVIESYEDLQAALHELRSAGMRVAVDDAGAGFASFRHIVRLNPDIIKLDVSLVQGVHRDPVRYALASALSSFGEEIGATIVAEGVEEPSEAAALSNLEMGCCVQGYLVARPAPLPLVSNFTPELAKDGGRWGSQVKLSIPE